MEPMDEETESTEVLAYLIWEQEGYPEDQSLRHWLEAETLISTKSLLEEQ
jgi:hypothetical protein